MSLIAGVPNSATPVSVVLKNVNEGGSFSNLLGTSFADDGVAFPTASASFNGTFMPATSLDAAFATPSTGESETPALAWFACMACGPQYFRMLYCAFCAFKVAYYYKTLQD